MRWYVDGMNVIGTRPDGWWRDRDAAMLHLVDLLERWAATEGEDVVVVFERAPRPPLRSTVIEIANAPKPKADAADDEIVRRLAREPHPGLVRVVTSDRWLADRAHAVGASVHGADSFRSLLEPFDSDAAFPARPCAPRVGEFVGDGLPQSVVWPTSKPRTAPPPQRGRAQPPAPGTHGWKVTPAPDGRGAQRPPQPPRQPDPDAVVDRSASSSRCWCSTSCSPARR